MARWDKHTLDDVVSTLGALVAQSKETTKQLHKIRDEIEIGAADASEYNENFFLVLQDVMSQAIALRNVQR